MPQPENVLLAEDGSAKLSDFGLGALPETANTEDGKLMTTCGTPNYVAPEVLAKKGYAGAPADIWSLGARPLPSGLPSSMKPGPPPVGTMQYLRHWMLGICLAWAAARM